MSRNKSAVASAPQRDLRFGSPVSIKIFQNRLAIRRFSVYEIKTENISGAAEKA
jgi:hypothetical protein